MNRGFYTSVSGLSAAQSGLAVVGHNMANSSTVGYTRQTVVQTDYGYQAVGNSLQVGLGTDVAAIRQIRDAFLDVSYRASVGGVNYHAAIYQTGRQIEEIIGEMESSYTAQSIINSVWDAVNELSLHPEGVETRTAFISTMQAYLTKMDNTYDRLTAEQYNLNETVKSTVTRINQLTTAIEELNNIIAGAEISGQNANDYRDERNLCLDELSKLIKIEYSENARGYVTVTTNGNELVANGYVAKLGLRYTSANSALVEPVFTASKSILPYDPTYQNARALFRFTGTAGASAGNDYGELFGLMVARGLYACGDYSALSAADFVDFGTPYNNATPAMAYLSAAYGVAIPAMPTLAWPDPADYTDGINDTHYINDYQAYLNEHTTYVNEMEAFFASPGIAGDPVTAAEYAAFSADPSTIDVKAYAGDLKIALAYGAFNATQCTISKTALELDSLFSYIVNMINDAFGSGYDLNGNLGTKPFVPINGTEITMGNVAINPLLLTDDGYNFIGLASSLTSGPGDATQVELVLAKWEEAGVSISGSDLMNIGDAYRYIVNNVAAVTTEAKSYYNSELTTANELDAKRLSISGVSLEEEMRNMLIYQHAFNAASRVVTVIDSMLDKLINGTGRVGL